MVPDIETIEGSLLRRTLRFELYRVAEVIPANAELGLTVSDDDDDCTCVEGGGRAGIYCNSSSIP